MRRIRLNRQPRLLRRSTANSLRGRRSLAAASNSAASQSAGASNSGNRSVLGRGELVRDFISASLYAPERGYFNVGNVVASPAERLNFPQMLGKAAYYSKLAELYKLVPEGWLTPVEIFQPVYGQAILAWVLERRLELAAARARALGKPAHLLDGTEPLRIFEVGGGNGTLARDMLDQLRARHPDVYAVTKYTIVELSSALHARQKQTLAEHKDRVELINMSILDWKTAVPEDCFVIALEVLDNMPHDKIVEVNGHPFQVHVRAVQSPDGAEKFTEEYAPLSDPLLREFWQHFKLAPPPTYVPKPIKFRWGVLHLLRRFFAWYRGMVLESYEAFREWRLKLSARHDKQQAVQGIFAPTSSLQFLHVLNAHFPKHNLLLADFDTLPSTVPGANAPVVASKSKSTDGKTVDYATYLVPQGVADIFFPTNFTVLAYMYRQICQERGGRANVWKHPDFMARYASVTQTATRSGFNPLLEDFTNASVLVSAPNVLPGEEVPASRGHTVLPANVLADASRLRTRRLKAEKAAADARLTQSATAAGSASETHLQSSQAHERTAGSAPNSSAPPSSTSSSASSS